MKHERWDDVEIIETFADEPAWTGQRQPDQGQPDVLVPRVVREARPGRLVALTLLGVGVLLGGLTGYGWGRSAKPVVIQHPQAVSPASEVVPSVQALGMYGDTGPCDRLAATDSTIVPTDPVLAAIAHYFPHLLISSAATSRYDDNNDICAVDVTAVDQQLVLNVSVQYFGIQDDLISTSTGSQGGQANLSFTRDFGEGQYSVSAQFTDPSAAGLPTLPLLQSFVNDPTIARRN